MWCLVVLACGVLGQAPSGERLENDRIAYRRAIVSCQLKFRSEYKSPTHRRSHGELWFDGAKTRMDVYYPYEGDTRIYGGLSPHPGETHYRETKCVTDEECIKYTSARVASGQYIAVLLRERGHEESMKIVMVTDPRLIGTVASAFLDLAVYTFGLGHAEAGWKPGAVTPVEYRGIDCWEAEFSHPSGSDVRKILDPTKGFSVVYDEASFGSEENFTLDTLECSLSQHQPSGIWFPSKCVYERTTGGKQISYEELEIEVVSMNEPLSDKIFQLAGMDIPPGRDINRGPPDPRGSVYWNGEQIVPVSASVRDLPEAEPERRRWLFIGVSVALSLITFSLLWRYLKNRGQPKSPG
jgi:hypothetical protein